MTQNDLTNVSNRDRVVVTLESGETFDGMAIDVEHEPADEYASGYTQFVFEGDWWGQVNDRVDSEVLHVEQSRERRTDEPGEIKLTGTVWVGETEESSVPEYKSLGEVADVEVEQ